MKWREARGENEASVPKPWGSQVSPMELRHSAFPESGPCSPEDHREACAALPTILLQ